MTDEGSAPPKKAEVISSNTTAMADRIGVATRTFRADHAILASTTMVQSSAAGYDALVAGIDEVSARSVLAAMQDRLARDPASALGLVENATVDDVRAAFLQLTKQYHPVRFGRMALDIQRLSNEVFLALRAAHDALAKALRRASGPIPSNRTSASMSVQPASPPNHGAPPHNAPPQNASPQTGRITQQLPVRPSRPLLSNESGERPPVSLPRTVTPSTGVKAPVSRPPAPQPAPRPPIAVRQTGGYPVVAPADEATAVDLLQRQQWDQARSVLHQLSARDPGSKRIRALMCYARGREAQLDRRVDDARVELQDALDLDPDLQLAKTALTELFTRRK
jgi:hypothetical protein